jgi:short-subunit dehydrogenase
LVGVPTQGLYAASKFAIEGLSESMAHELEPFGVYVTLVEPGMYATEFIGPSMRLAEFTDAHASIWEALIKRYEGASLGDLVRMAESVLTLVNTTTPAAAPAAR